MFPVEGTVQDADGACVSVLLHQDENDRLYELELVRYEDGDEVGNTEDGMTKKSNRNSRANAERVCATNHDHR